MKRRKTDPSPCRSTTTGVILAGGVSSRFGSNKALALLAGRPLVVHVAAALEKLFANRLLVTNTPGDYQFLGWPMTGDIHPGSGPLGGIHAALAVISDHQAFICGCDMPLIHPDLISHLCNLPGDWDVALPWLKAGPEPLYGVYRKSALDVIENQLARRELKLLHTLEKLKVRKIGEQEVLELTADLRPFHNINRLVDLEALIPGRTGHD